LISPRSMAAAIMLYAARSLHYHQVVAWALIKFYILICSVSSFY
jgi:hypothetical protein